MIYMRIKKKKETDSTEKVKKNKFNAKKKEIDGIIFDSTLESKYYEHLKEEVLLNRIKSFSLQPKYILQESFITYDNKTIYKSNPNFTSIKNKYKLKVTKSITYKADFLIINNDDTILDIDVKGSYLTEVFKLKRKLFNAVYPCNTLKLITFNKDDGWVEL